MFTLFMVNTKRDVVIPNCAILNEMAFFKIIAVAAGLAALSATSATAGAGAMTSLAGLATDKTTSSSTVQKVH